MKKTAQRCAVGAAYLKCHFGSYASARQRRTGSAGRPR